MLSNNVNEGVDVVDIDEESMNANWSETGANTLTRAVYIVMLTISQELCIYVNNLTRAVYIC